MINPDSDLAFALALQSAVGPEGDRARQEKINADLQHGFRVDVTYPFYVSHGVYVITRSENDFFKVRLEMGGSLPLLSGEEDEAAMSSQTVQVERIDLSHPLGGKILEYWEVGSQSIGPAGFAGENFIPVEGDLDEDKFWERYFTSEADISATSALLEAAKVDIQASTPDATAVFTWVSGSQEGTGGTTRG